jgi:NH3-dependent NAD+ synthetase
MTTLYYFAGIHGLLVTGTGNKVEDFELVYNKDGDGGVDLSPIADLMKSSVFFGRLSKCSRINSECGSVRRPLR